MSDHLIVREKQTASELNSVDSLVKLAILDGRSSLAVEDVYLLLGEDNMDVLAGFDTTLTVDTHGVGLASEFEVDVRDLAHRFGDLYCHRDGVILVTAAEVDVFRPDTQCHIIASVCQSVTRVRGDLVTELVVLKGRPVLADRQEVHRWRPDEAGDELVDGTVVALQRFTDLLEFAVVE